MFLQQDWQLYSRLVPHSFDILRLTFRALGATYSMINHVPGYIGANYLNKFCGRAIVQYHPRPRIKVTPDAPNLLLLNVLTYEGTSDMSSKAAKPENMQLFQYLPNYLSNFAWTKVKGKCHQLVQYNSNNFNGLPPRITVLDEIAPGIHRKLQAITVKATNLNSKT